MSKESLTEGDVVRLLQEAGVIYEGEGLYSFPEGGKMPRNCMSCPHSYKEYIWVWCFYDEDDERLIENPFKIPKWCARAKDERKQK